VIGPTVKIKLSCFDCEHCKTSSYTCQGDSGSDVYCGAMNNKTIGDTRWETPDWCPYRGPAITAAIKGILPRARSYKDLMAMLYMHGIANVPQGKNEMARKWRANEITTDEFISDLKGEHDKKAEGTEGVRHTDAKAGEGSTSGA
jgi:hypothetical protein